MRVVVTGASGNVGSGVLRALARHLPDAQVVGVCRRPPTDGELYRRVQWHAVDLSDPDAADRLEPAVRGADVVIHLALAVQPVRDTEYLHRANVRGSQALLTAITRAGVPQLVYASSLGIYAPGTREPVTEDWPDTGQPASTYSMHKVEVERILDAFVDEHPDVVVSRFRPTVVVQREAAWLIRTLYLGPVIPLSALELLRRGGLPILPLPAGLRLQFVHTDDVGDAVVRLVQQRARGSFNVAADLLDSDALAGLVGARPVGVPRGLVRSMVSALSTARLIALSPGWHDVAFNTPPMDTTKARAELGWTPQHDSLECARELIDGLADNVLGQTAAMGRDSFAENRFRTVAAQTHDVSLVLWTTLAALRALGLRRAGAADTAVVATNLVAGTPPALDRVLLGRRDPVALLAPTAVLASLAATWRGGWAPVAATAVLHVLNVLERRRGSSK